MVWLPQQVGTCPACASTEAGMARSTGANFTRRLQSTTSASYIAEQEESGPTSEKAVAPGEEVSGREAVARSRWRKAGTIVRTQLMVVAVMANRRQPGGQQDERADEEERRRELRSSFDSFVRPPATALDLEGMRALLRALGQEVSNEEVRDRVRELDKDGSGAIEFEEFAAMMAEWKEQELRDMFSLFDDDRSGSIDMSELHQSLLELGLELGEEKLAKLAATADADASGQIDEAEFVNFFR